MKFSTHVATVGVALALIVPTGALVLVRMAKGLPALEGYGDWYLFLGSLAGVTSITGMFTAGISAKATDK